MSRPAIGFLVTLFVVSSLPAQPQVQTPANPVLGSLKGAVVDSVTGLPIEGVQVTIVSGQPVPEEGVQSLFKGRAPTPEEPQITTTLEALTVRGRTLMPERSMHFVRSDSQGRFVFNRLPAASYSVSFRADGYNFQVLGEKPDSLTWLPIVIQNSEADVGVVRMSPYPQIRGRVVDLAGLPIAGVPVYLLNAKPNVNVDGEKSFRAVSETVTDAAGIYLLQKIAAGRYFVATGSFGSREMIRYAPGATREEGVRVPAQLPTPFTFYPGVPDAGLAGEIDAPAGIKVELGDLVVRRQGLASLRGSVIDDTTGKPPVNVRVTLNAWFPFLRAGRYGTETVSINYDRTSGVFEAKDLISGTYRVDAVLPRPQGAATPPVGAALGGIAPQSSFQILEVRNADVQDLVLRVPANGRVAGKVVVSDGKPLPVAERILSIPLQLMLRPLGPLQPAPTVTAVSVQDGTFQVDSVLEGKYRYSIGPLRDNHYVSEARLDGVRVTNGILDISKTAQSDLIFTLSPGGEIQGAVVDKQSKPVQQAQGIVLPDPLPEIISFYADVEANAAGRFTVNGIPPGNYKVYVWDGIAPAQFFDRELLARSGHLASPVRVERGSAVSVSVQVIAP
jgi:hypothetical protein